MAVSKPETVSEHEIASIIEWLGGELEEGSDKDKEARRALAKVLRWGPWDRSLLCALADLIDSDEETREDLGLWLVFRRPPGRAKTVNERLVAAVAWEWIQAGHPREAAYQHAVEELGVSLRTAKKALKAWENHFVRDGARLKGLTRIRG
jgi:hypothetical protein